MFRGTSVPVMAAATEAKPSSKKLKFVGPAQRNFETFIDLCIYSANLYCPDWNNYQNPSSYMIPLVFNYLHPDVSDEAAQIVHERETLLRRVHGAANTKRDRLLTDRTSDIAEHIVYTACQQLIEDKVQAPILVVHSLNIHNSQDPIRQLFPIVDEEPFREALKQCREYDFLIFGPTIGLIAIEVKSSQYTARRDFVVTSKLLPQDYYKGLQQLESADALSQILRACAEIDLSINKIPIRKVLFTPNLNRVRYATWMDSIGDEARQKIETSNSVLQWFTEDMDNRPDHFDKPPLYTKFRNVLETSTVNLRRSQTRASEKYTLLLLGFRSMIYLAGNLELSTVNLSHNKAISLVHRRIVEQNPFEGQEDTKVSEHSLLKRIEESKLNYEPKLFFLSPDQQAVLDGPARQFIIGAAGTGKTVILQAKALELLSKGEKVVIFAPKHYKQKYKQLFKSYGFKTFQCCTWPYMDFEDTRRELDKYMEATSRDGTYNIKEVMRYICECIKTGATSMKLNRFIDKNIMIDDTCDERLVYLRSRVVNQVSHLFVAWALIACIREVRPAKITWAAFDPTIVDGLFANKRNPLPANIFRTAVEELLSNGFDEGCGVRVHVSTLRQVMRCSESVYQTAYSTQNSLRYVDGMEPILAHKIQGFKHTVMTPSNDCLGSMICQDSMTLLRKMVRTTLRHLSRKGVSTANVGIISGQVPFPLSSFKIGKVSIPVHSCDEVSSLEWPVVIYASSFVEDFSQHLSNEEVNLIGYQRYRAMTRATAALIEITVPYRRPVLLYNEHKYLGACLCL